MDACALGLIGGRAARERPAAPFGPPVRRPAAKTESLASEWSQLSDYSGPDPAESAYKVPPPPRPLPGLLGGSAPPSPAPATGTRTGNYLDMSGSHSGTPSPSQVQIVANSCTILLGSFANLVYISKKSILHSYNFTWRSFIGHVNM